MRSLKVTKIQLPSGSVGGKPEEKPDDDDYVDLGELGSFIKPITNLLEAKGYQFDVTVKADSLTETLADAWDQTLHVDISRGDGNAVSAQVTATLFKKDLILTYFDDTIYLKFGDGIKLQLKATEESELIAKLKEIFARRKTEELLQSWITAHFCPELSGLYQGNSAQRWRSGVRRN